MKLNFKEYLHGDNTSYELAEWIYSQVKDKFEGTEEDLLALIGNNRPFYEVGLNCELDTVTGDIRILGLA
jgi:hypothetical protein